MAPFPVQLDGKNYDIKKFLRDHPGGVNTLKSYEGVNIVRAMEKFGHSVNAYHMLNDFKVESEKDNNLTGVSGNGRIITREEGSIRDKAEIEYLEDLEGRLDWSKPILSQLDTIAPDYDKWVNSAVYRHCQIFANPLLEAMTFTPWYLVPAFWIPVILYLGYTQFTEHVLSASDPMSAFKFTWHLAVGVVLWTIIEYSLHRWVFHLDPGKSLTMIKIHFLIHGLHHKMPFDGLRQVFPPIPALALACIIYLPLQLFLSYPVIKLTGGLVGYLTYDMIHYYVHHGSPADGTYLYAMKRYHSNHHFVNHDRAFGISCDIWDHVFKTFVKLRTLGFSLRWD